jgi:hypothetical protein
VVHVDGFVSIDHFAEILLLDSISGTMHAKNNFNVKRPTIAHRIQLWKFLIDEIDTRKRHSDAGERREQAADQWADHEVRDGHRVHAARPVGLYEAIAGTEEGQEIAWPLPAGVEHIRVDFENEGLARRRETRLQRAAEPSLL